MASGQNLKTEPMALSQVVETLLRHSIRVGAARLNGLLKDLAEASFVSGHDFSRGERACVFVARAGFSRAKGCEKNSSAAEEGVLRPAGPCGVRA